MENQDLLTYVAVIVGLIGVLYPILVKYTNMSQLKKLQEDTKILQKEYENNLQKIEKELEQKKAELENSVKAYDEKFAAVHQVLTDFQIFVIDRTNDTVISQAEKKLTKEDIDKFGKLI